MSQPHPLDLLDPTFKANPFPTYAALREREPVARLELPDGQPIWLVTRYDDVLLALKDQRLAKDRFSMLTPEQLAAMPPIPEELKPFTRNMLDLDDPDHARLRGLVHKGFTPQRIAELRTIITTLVDELLDAITAAGSVDLIDALAFPLPATIIARLLGIPEADLPRFRAWSNAMVAVTSSEEYAAVIPVMQAFMQFVRELIAARRAEPRDDLITALVEAEEQGQRLSEDEVLAMIVLLLIAGHETTVNLIGNGVATLLQHPEQLDLLQRQPELLPSAIEEILRYAPPVEMATERFAREPLTIAGVRIPAGEQVLAVLAAANRDHTQFADPERFDITRSPNRHLTFGQGIHFCLGAPLARMEGQIALARLLERLPNLRLAVDPADLRWKPNLILRGLEALPVIC